MSLQHGHARNHKSSPTHLSWQRMIQRCTNPRHNRYYAYGAKGVQVCSRWLDFRNFLQDMGVRPEGCTLGRHNDTGNYEPGNVSWQSSKEQARRGARNHMSRLTAETVLVARALYVKGATRGCSLKNMARDLGIAEPTLSQAIRGVTWSHLDESDPNYQTKMVT